MNLLSKRHSRRNAARLQQEANTDIMIDAHGFRPGVGIIIVNNKRQVFLAKRIGKEAWQFPQGGIKPNETPEQAMFRELKEEVGLKDSDIKILAVTERWLRYRLPQRLIRKHSKPVCVGQKQKWFLLLLINEKAQFDLLATETPEFDSWAWVSFWYPLRQVIWFKKDVYMEAMKEFANIVLSRRFWQN